MGEVSFSAVVSLLMWRTYRHAYFLWGSISTADIAETLIIYVLLSWLRGVLDFTLMNRQFAAHMQKFFGISSHVAKRTLEVKESNINGIFEIIQ